jgi:regulatory factor X
MQGHSGLYMVDASMHPHGHGPGGFGPDAANLQHGVGSYMGPPNQLTPVESKDNSTFGMNGEDSLLADNGADNMKRKKSTAVSQVNDSELKKLFDDNKDRDLHDVALQVTRDEKGPKAEKTKQIFGMLW